MASNLKAKFEEMGKAPPPTHSIEDVERERIIQEEIRKKTWAHSGNSVTFPKSNSISFFCALLTFPLFVPKGRRSHWP
jgi:hypothetical protein